MLAAANAMDSGEQKITDLNFSPEKRKRKKKNRNSFYLKFQEIK
jgi:hypothetical protein